MHRVAQVAALVLAVVFVRAGVAKLTDRPSTTSAFRELGLPRLAATVVPIAELILAAALIVIPGWGAVFALALLAAFTTFLTLALRAGVPAPCNCFGNARPATVSWKALARNCVLAALAVVALGA
jgi:uncharacterized membrane protein YphA (DoxX/SURF4 family)